MFQISEAGRCGGVQTRAICFGLTPAVKIKACVLLYLNACCCIRDPAAGWDVKPVSMSGVLRVLLVTGMFWINKLIYNHL